MNSLQSEKGYTIDLGISADNVLDKYWVKECDGLWFKPVRLDAIHGYYTGYWYADRASVGGQHYHSGSTHGISLYGKMIFTDKNDNVITVESNEYFYIPPGVTHKAEIIADPKGFLFYSTVEGDIIYFDDDGRPKNKIDVFDYIDLLEQHFQENNLNKDKLSKLIVR